MSEPFHVKDEGYLTLQLEHGDRPPIEIRLDLYRAQSRFVEMQEPAVEGDADADRAEKNRRMLERTVEYLKECGLPEVSHQTAMAIRAEVFRRTGTTKGKDDPAQSSTGSPG